MKLKYAIFLLVVLIMPNVANAEYCYFKNDNDVCLTIEEYDFLVKRLWNGFPEIMTKTDYEKLVQEDLINNDVESVIVEDKNFYFATPKSSYYATSNKSVKISKVCSSSYCGITVVAEWFSNPNVRSYDVIGAYLDGVTLLTSPSTYLTSSSGTISSSEIVNQANGFGVSVKLPSGSTGIVLYQYYDTGTSGTIYASYQHAKSTISLANSKLYTVSRSGYGGVFLFNSSIRSKYDGMGGVDIVL